MGLPKRLTKARKIIARVDPALANVSFDLLKKYFATLDIEVLGDLTKLHPRPVVFDVEPLKSHLASLDKGVDRAGKDQCTPDDLWAIFASHVTGCDDKTVCFDTEGEGKFKHLKEECRDQFFESYIIDLANAVRQLASGDGVIVPFSPPAGIAEKIFTQRSQSARSPDQAVLSAVVKNSE